MRIAMIIEAWKPIWGGGQAHVFELSKKLVKNHNCKIDIYVMNLKDETGNTQQRIEGYKYENLKIIRTGKPRNFYSFKDRILWIFNVVKEIKKNHKQNNYDLIHAHANLPGIPGKILSRLLRIPLVYTIHGTNFLDLKKKNLFYFVEKLLFTTFKYDAQISVSKNILKYKNNNTPTIIPNGVSLKKFSCQSINKTGKDYFKIIFVGRLDKIKGIDILLKSLSTIKKQLLQKKVQVHLIGYGYEEKYFKELSKKLKLQNIVFFRGKIIDERLTREYCTSNLFVLPSLSEGQPLTLLEAWAAKLPVIVTDVGDNKYFVENKINGYIIPPKDTEALSKKIIETINNPNLKQLGLKGYNLINKKYTWTRVAKQTYKIYQVLS